MTMQRNSEGMVYRGREDRVHIADGERAKMGRVIAGILDGHIRRAAYRSEGETPAALVRLYGDNALPLCPGCYMTAVYNMAVTLAEQNGQSLKELGRTMALAFLKLADGEQVHVEEVRVILDTDE